METADIKVALDTIWILFGAVLVFIMQAGFAMVEAGFSRHKNSANILMKNLLDFSVGSLLYWAIGFGLMFGVGSFVGMPDFFGFAGWEGNVPTEAFFIFQTMFCATAATIVSGAVAERTKFSAYLIYSALIFGVIYPISGHWTWGGGWLAEMGFHDFAGSTVVHALGGWCALVGAWVVGPRLGKYRNGKIRPIPGHSLTIASLGAFLLWFGWFGFNGGSQLAASSLGDMKAISLVFLTTNTAAAAGCVTVLILGWIKYGKPSLSLCLNGVLAGLVGITAGCDWVSPAGAAAIGVLSGIAMLYAVEFIDSKLKIDDPVGAISVHGVCGTLGTILTGVFAVDGGLLYSGDWTMLGVQTIGALAVAAWALVMAFIVFKGIDMTKGMRVNKRIEEEGLDIYEHGETAYN